MRLLIVGNGATAVDGNARAFTNQHTCQFMNELADQGHSVTLMQPRIAFDPASNVYDKEIPTSRIGSATIPRGSFFGSLRAAAAALAAILSAQFVYIFYPGTLPRLAALLCLALRKPYGLYLRGEQFSRARGGDRIIRNARFIVTVSDYLAAPFREVNPKITQIRPMNGLLPGDIRDLAIPDETPRPLRLLFVGRLEPAKGLQELMEAASLLEARGTDFKLTIVGGGPLLASLEKQAGDRIQLTGVVADKSELMRIYEESHIFVLPTHHEGFPRVLYEAMTKGNAVVTTMVGGIPGVMTEEENCLGIPVKDSAAIADAVERLARDPALRNRLAQAGLETAKEILLERPSHLQAFNLHLASSRASRSCWP
jgi:glycosyltransferase involved in cell wall biosynthesis